MDLARQMKYFLIALALILFLLPAAAYMAETSPTPTQPPAAASSQK